MRLRSAIVRAILQQNATVLISFVAGVFIARLLSPHEVGAYAVAMAAVNLAFAAKDSGLTSFVVTNAELDEPLLRSAFGLTLVMSGGLTAIFAATSWPLARFYGDPALGEALRIVAVAQIPSALAFPATVILMRAMRFDILLVVGLIGAGVQSATSIGLALAGASTAALGWGYLLGATAAAVATFAARPASLRVLPSLSRTAQLLTFGMWMSATLLISNAAVALPELMIGRAFGLGDAALFSRAQNIVSVIRNGFSFAVMRPVLPKFGEFEHCHGGMGDIALRVAASVTGLAWPSYAILTIWAEPLIRLVYGPAWVGASALAAPLALAQGLSLAVAPYWEVLIVKRRAGLLLTCEAASLIAVAICMGVSLIWGVEAAAWGLVLSQVLMTCVNSAVTGTLAGFRIRSLLAVWGKSLALAAAAAPAPLLFRLHAASDPITLLLEVLSSTMLSALIWLFALRVLDHELRHHVEPVLRDILAGVAKPLAKRSAPMRNPLAKRRI